MSAEHSIGNVSPPDRNDLEDLDDLDDLVTGRDDLLALSDECGVPLKDLLALDPSNDPFNTGTEADWEKARWIAAAAANLIGKHARGVHYAFLARQTIKPDGTVYTGTDADQTLLHEAVCAARELGLLPRDAFPDRKSTLIADGTYQRLYEPPTAEVSAPCGELPRLTAAGVRGRC